MAIEKKPWQRLLYEIWATVTEGHAFEVESLTVTKNDTYTAPEGKAYSPVTVNVSGGTLDVGDLLSIQHCATNIAVNDEYYPDSNYEGIARISYESTELVSSIYGVVPENGIASGLTIVTPPEPIIVNTITFFKLTVESNTVTAVDDITDDIDFSVIDAGEGSSSIQLVIPSSDLFSENEYFAVSYSTND